MNKLIGAVALTLFASGVVGQCAIVGTGTSYGSGDDFVANAGAGIDMGFAFPVGASSFQFIHPCSNGYIWLSDGSPTLATADFSASEVELTTLDPRIAAFWTDINLDAANGGELWVETSVPNQCTITWSNAVLFGQTTLFNFSCTLSNSGIIDINYDLAVYQTADAIVGLSPGLGVVSPGSVDLSAQAPTFDDSTFELFAGNTFDLANQLLTLIPVVPGYVPVLAAPVGCADKQLYGTGCVSVADAVYELFPLNTLDICGTGTAITFLRDPSGYTVLDGIPGIYVPPSAPTVVSVADDAFGVVPLSIPMPTVNGPTSSLQVCTNGYIGLSANAPSAAADYSPTAAEFAAFTEPTICGPWYDWSPNAGGQLVYEEIAGIMYVTWDAITPYGVTTTDTFQYQFELATGNCTIVFDNTTFGGASGWHTPLFGYTNGSPAYSEGLDMSVALSSALTIGDAGSVPLALDSNLPIVGQNWDITTSNIDAVSPIAITFFGSAQFTLPLTAIGLAAPGCDINIDTVLASITSLSAGNSATASVPVPSNPILLGSVLTAQSICLTLNNPANLLTSNGLQGTLGN